MLGIAWQWQAELHGGFSVDRPSGGLRDARGGLPAERCTEPERVPTAPGAAVPGSRLIRVWKAERHEVQVTETGYLWRGRSWGSLSSIAGEITGARRNGPAFFGLRDKDAP